MPDKMKGHDRFTAIVLAGTRPEGDKLAIAEGVPAKALIDIAGQPMIKHVLSTLQNCPMVDEIIISGQETLFQSYGYKCVQSDISPSLSVQRVLMQVPHGKPVLITTADHPLLTVATLTRFLEDSLNAPCDATVGLVDASLVKAAYPKSRRTVLKFRGEKLHGSNLFTLLGDPARALPIFWRTLEKHRKKPVRMAEEIGLWSCLLYVLGMLPLRNALDKIGRKTGSVVKAVMLNDPAAAMDVDKKAHLALVRGTFKKERLN